MGACFQTGEKQVTVKFLHTSSCEVQIMWFGVNENFDLEVICMNMFSHNFLRNGLDFCSNFALTSALTFFLTFTLNTLKGLE